MLQASYCWREMAEPHFNWKNVVYQADEMVDEYWGETILIQPWNQDNEYAQGGPDTTRPALEIIACFIGTPGQVIREGGFNTPTSSVGNRLSLRVEYVIECDLKSGDLVILPERGNEIYQVSYVDPGDSGRSNAPLLVSKIPPTLALSRPITKRYPRPHNTLKKMMKTIQPEKAKKVEAKKTAASVKRKFINRQKGEKA